ncbi:hypothetical protein ACFQY0_01265 [Haloferula chungangensis]|uniref:DUF2178 domain-containing protein n=1 Tax=Haloferula chungangensis TaxID=1048331 RepID=A0ABW2L0C7_9BACT
MNSETILEALSGFAIVLFAGLLALGVVAMLREGLGDPDRRSDSSAAASFHGMMGILLIPVATGYGMVMLFRTAVEQGKGPVVWGMAAGLALAIMLLGRRVIFPGSRR